MMLLIAGILFISLVLSVFYLTAVRRIAKQVDGEVIRDGCVRE
jgi:hypothetical protein